MSFNVFWQGKFSEFSGTYIVKFASLKDMVSSSQDRKKKLLSCSCCYFYFYKYSLKGLCIAKMEFLHFCYQNAWFWWACLNVLALFSIFSCLPEDPCYCQIYFLSYCNVYMYLCNCVSGVHVFLIQMLLVCIALFISVIVCIWVKLDSRGLTT